MGAHLQCSHLDLSLNVSGAVRGEQAGQSTNHSKRYPKTHNPWPPVHVSFYQQWRGPRMSAQEPLVLKLGLQISTNSSGANVAAIKSQAMKILVWGQVPVL